MAKKAKNSKEYLRDSEVNESLGSKYSSDNFSLYEFFRDKLMKNLFRAAESKIQSKFVSFNQGFKYKDYLENKTTKHKKQ